MSDDVTYSMEMFETLEMLVQSAKLLDMTYEQAYSDAVNIAITRSSMGVMGEATALYDSSNILATFNIIWGA